jgi:hypothetical protein
MLLRQCGSRWRIDVLVRRQPSEGIEVEPVAVSARAPDQIVRLTRIASHDHVVRRRPPAARVLDAPLVVRACRGEARMAVVNRRNGPEQDNAMIAGRAQAQVPTLGVVDRPNDSKRLAGRNRARGTDRPASAAGRRWRFGKTFALRRCSG